MTQEQLKQKQNQLKKEFKQKENELLCRFTESNNNVKIGDLIEDHLRQGIVVNIMHGKLTHASSVPECIYEILHLTKAKTVSKKSKYVLSWQQNLKTIEKLNWKDWSVLQSLPNSLYAVKYKGGGYDVLKSFSGHWINALDLVISVAKL